MNNKLNQVPPPSRPTLDRVEPSSRPASCGRFEGMLKTIEKKPELAVRVSRMKFPRLWEYMVGEARPDERRVSRLRRWLF